jgi:hypothetical protein
MPAKPIRIPISNVLLGSDYTGQLQIGAAKKAVNVLLDTGSSTLALDHKAYDPTQDAAAKKTNLVQVVQYGSGNWVGSVVQTEVGVGGAQGDILNDVNLAVAFHESAHMFGKGQGILGLAYASLNDAYQLSKPSLPPTYSPNDIQAAHQTTIEPYFMQLESSGLAANKFAFYTKRSIVRVAAGGNPAADPLNQGFLILGGGEEAKDLYQGAFQTAVVLSDDWYSTNLKQVIVGKAAPIQVLPPTRADRVPSNSIVDSGTNGLDLAPHLYDDILSKLDPVQQTAVKSGGVKSNNLNLAQWPTLTFVLQGQKGDVSLVIKPEDYWQVDAGEPGLALCSLWRGTDVQSILGLPLMNGYFTVFDCAANHGLGVVKFATRK